MFSKSLGFLFSLLFFLFKAVSIFFLLLCEIAVVSYIRFPLQFCSGNWRAGAGKNDPFVHTRGLTGAFPEPKACINSCDVTIVSETTNLCIFHKMATALSLGNQLQRYANNTTKSGDRRSD